MARFLKTMIGEELERLVDDVESCILIDFRGLAAPEVDELRRTLRAQGVTMNVVPNRLYRRALLEHWEGAEGSADALARLLRGPTAVLFGGDGAVTAAKAIVDWRKGHEKAAIKGGLVDRRVIAAGDVEDLARIPSREALMAQIAGVMAEPFRRIVWSIDGAARGVVRAVGAIVEKMEKGPRETGS